MKKQQQQALHKIFPAYRLAQLMSITPSEFDMLQHTGLSSVADKAGEVVGYYLRLSRRNSKQLLNRIKYDSRMHVYFDALRLEIDI